MLPVLKWAGGKQWLAPLAPLLVPKEFDGRYFEPFLGGGSFFFAVSPKRATLSDRNEDLIAAYSVLRSNPRSIIQLLQRFPHSKSFYYTLRSRTPRTSVGAAARLLYLNRTCWNGLYRVNQRGQFNTPFGRQTNPTICDSERLKQAAKALRGAKLIADDFEVVASKAREGDFVYLDPPYITGHQHNGFLKYNAALFSWADQQRLAALAIDLVGRGVHVLVSNADHHTVVSLYKGFRHYRVARSSLIGSKPSSRGRVVEALLASYPVLDCDPGVI